MAPAVVFHMGDVLCGLNDRDTATALVPSADKATESHWLILEFGIHVAPESLDTHRYPQDAAANLLPSADEAMDLHCCCGVASGFQVMPESPSG